MYDLENIFELKREKTLKKSNKKFNFENSVNLMTSKRAFNRRVANWSLEDGYTSGQNGREYPLRTFNVGEQSGLTLHLRSYDKDLQYVCDAKRLGYTVTLSTAGEAFKTQRQTFRVPLFEDAQITIKPRMFKTAKGLRSYSPNDRNCYFSTERRLYFFDKYTQSNCEAECLTNFTELVCGCVRFSMPSENDSFVCCFFFFAAFLVDSVNFA